MDYKEFIESKTNLSGNFGFKPVWIPDTLFDFQKHIVEWALRKGRAAVFADTGLGKTLIELVIAKNYIQKFNKPVLILTPLAVAFQFLKEAQKFGIDDIEYSKEGKFTKKIVICNYERLQYFNASDFDCVLLDESSILKNFNGAIKSQVTTFMKKVKYRFLFTATPSPNDFVELGTSSEALGYMGYMEMLSTFFANNENNIRPQEIGCKWYLKPHAQKAFFKWVSSWAISIKNPSDLGFDDSRFILPELKLNYYPVKNNKNWVSHGTPQIFNIIAKTMSEVREEQKMTINQRCEKSVELAKNHSTSVYWCYFNDEGDLLQELDKSAYQLKGAMSIDEKESILLGFYNGEIKKLITKPKITCFGLNWQHCNHTVYFPTWSYEQYYQSIRRFWRFGQTKEVICDLVYSDGQKRVIDTLLLKTENAKELFKKLIEFTNEKYDLKQNEFTQKIELPTFLK